MNYQKKVIIKIKKYLELEIIVDDYNQKKLVLNYLQKARHNFLVSQFIEKGTSNQKVLEELGFSTELRAFDWVINTAYYAMYMAAQAVLAAIGIKCENHTATPYALEYYFVFQDTLEQQYVDLLRESQTMEPVEVERLRRGKELRLEAQYDVSKSMIQERALSLLSDAGRFIERMELLIAAISKQDDVISK